MQHKYKYPTNNTGDNSQKSLFLLLLIGIMIDTQTIYLFIKFGQKEHIEDLYNNGVIYMNPIQSFTTIEDNELRGDRYEGVRRIKNYPKGGQYKIPSMGIEGNYISFQVRESYEELIGNIYSLYCVSTLGWNDSIEFKIDEKNKRLGSHCLFVKDNAKFLSLIEDKLMEQNLKYSHGFVKYYDKDKVSRKIGLFEKPNEFEYQKEFRIYVESQEIIPLILSIGSLKKIAEIYDAEKVVDTLKLEVNKSNKKPQNYKDNNIKE